MKLNLKKLITNYYSLITPPSPRLRRASNHQHGFTFIEILVVVTIIGVLMSIGTVTFQSANKKSRDAKRKADFEQIRAALEMYRTDYNLYADSLSDLTTYLNPIPTPPTNSTKCSDGSATTSYNDGFSCISPFTTYSLCIKLEEGGSAYTVYNP